VAMGGSFVVMRLVAASVQDRLTNQLIDTSQAASDSIVGQEQAQLDALRLVVFTVGVPEALIGRDAEALTGYMSTLASNQNVEMLIALDSAGVVITDVRRSDDGGYLSGQLAGQDLSILPMVRPVLEGQQDELGDKFAGVIKIDEESILLTAAPVRSDAGELIGLILVGTPLRSMLLQTKADILADLTFYQSDGLALETTFVLAGGQDLTALSISRDLYKEALFNPQEETSLRETLVSERHYQTAYIPLRIRNTVQGVLGVSLPTTIVNTLITTNRNGLSVVFALVASLVVVVGYGIAQNLSIPVRKLATTAEAVRAGDLTQQSGVRTTDEIGILGRTFDAMTLRLGEQTRSLADAYAVQRQQAAFLREVINAVKDGIIVVAPTGEIVAHNPAALAIFKLNRALLEDVISDIVNNVLNGHAVRQRFEVQGQWFEGVGALVLTATSEEVGVVVSMRDVTDEVLTERMRTAFIAQISHELRTPLAAVKGFVDLAQYVLTEANEQARGFLVTAVENINVLNRLINEILDVSQLVRGDLQLRVEQADINAILVEVADGFSEVIADKRLDFQTDYGDLPEIAGDPDRLRWALSQVVKNACNYTLPGGMVRVTTARENGSVVIRVRDNGVGITPRELPRIFEQFYRGFPTSTDGQLIDVRGAGLGLFILDQVVSAHGGSVAVQSAPGRGSEFAVRLPVSEG